MSTEVQWEYREKKPTFNLCVEQEGLSILQSIGDNIICLILGRRVSYIFPDRNIFLYLVLYVLIFLKIFQYKADYLFHLTLNRNFNNHIYLERSNVIYSYPKLE